MGFYIAIYEGLLLNFLFQGQISLIILGTRKIRLIPVLFILRITCDLCDHSQLILFVCSDISLFGGDVLFVWLV